MSQVLLFSDLHIYPHKRKIERLQDCLNALDWVFETARQRNITDILFGGDLFHDRQKIDILTYCKAFDCLYSNLKDGHFNLYLLLGNHDLWFNEKTSISSVKPLSTLPGVRVISDPERIKIAGHNWDFIPFTHNPVETVEMLREKPGKAEFALGHIALDGAILHGTQTADVMVEHDGDMVAVGVSLFEHYKHTFLGHYHAEQRVNSKVEYIGSPLELSFGEAFQEKHLVIFDGQKREYVVNDFSPKHLIIKAGEQHKYKLEGNFVQIKVDSMGTTDLVSMRKDILDQNKVGSLEIKPEKKAPVKDTLIKDAKAILFKGDEMLEKFVDEVGTNELNRARLLEVGKKICQFKKS